MLKQRWGKADGSLIHPALLPVIELPRIPAGYLEKEMLKASGFHDSGKRDSCGNELWEHKLGIPMETDIFSQIGYNMCVCTDGNILMKMEDGLYMDRRGNKYSMYDGNLVLIKEDTYEVTDSEYHGELGEESAYWEHEVKLQEDRFILVRIYIKTGNILIVKNSDGASVYGHDGETIPDFPYTERLVKAFVQYYYEKNEKGYENEL